MTFPQHGGFGNYAAYPTWDTRALLEPKSAAKKPSVNAATAHGTPTNGTGTARASFPDPHNANGNAENHKASNMIERLHNVQYRQDQPRKRVKTDNNDVEDLEEDPQKKSKFTAKGGAGQLGTYIKDKREEGLRNGPPESIVDLTKGNFFIYPSSRHSLTNSHCRNGGKG